MGSGKGYAKRTSLVNPVKSIKNFADTSKDYEKIKELILDDSKLSINLNKQSEYGKYNDEILTFMKHKDISFYEYQKGDTPNKNFLQEDIDYLENNSVMGVCHFSKDPKTNKPQIRILINNDLIEEEFLNTVATMMSSNSDFSNYDNNVNFLGSGRKVEEIYANYKQRIILHELGHAIMGISSRSLTGLNSTKDIQFYEEFKAELFAKKVLDEMYGDEDFHAIASVLYIKNCFQERVQESSEKKALNELASASMKASKAAREMLNYLGI